jgi:hypothetical protein
MFFTNKHVVIALIVAPILSILAWFAVGEIAGEKAKPAKWGESYPLVEKSNCRYESGRCGLENEGFKLTLQVAEGKDLSLASAHPLRRVMITVGDPTQELPPVAMIAADGAGLKWRYPMTTLPGSTDRIRVVATTEHNAYFGDASTVFIER